MPLPRINIYMWIMHIASSALRYYCVLCGVHLNRRSLIMFHITQCARTDRCHVDDLPTAEYYIRERNWRAAGATCDDELRLPLPPQLTFIAPLSRLKGRQYSGRQCPKTSRSDSAILDWMIGRKMQCGVDDACKHRFNFLAERYVSTVCHKTRRLLTTIVSLCADINNVSAYVCSSATKCR